MSRRRDLRACSCPTASSAAACYPPPLDEHHPGGTCSAWTSGDELLIGARAQLPNVRFAESMLRGAVGELGHHRGRDKRSDRRRAAAGDGRADAY
jgi:hypothetical protein